LSFSLAYPFIRAFEQSHTDERVNKTFNELHKSAQSSSDWRNTMADLSELRRQARAEVGLPLTQRMEEAVATGILHGFAKIGETFVKSRGNGEK
ncbi:hypothetical protein CLOM_g8461, partial [Closterium sp. NIES-68]